MGGYKHVLVALDESDDAIRVAHRAKEIAEAAGAQLSLLHIVDQRVLDAGAEAGVPLFAMSSASEQTPPLTVEPQPVPFSLDDRLMQSAQNFLRGVADELGGAPALHVAASSSIAAQVVAMAHSLDADLLVCGAHHRHGLALFLPSPVDGIVHHLPCDILLVRLRA